MPERPLAPTLRPFDAVGGWTIALVESLTKSVCSHDAPPFVLR